MSGTKSLSIKKSSGTLTGMGGGVRWGGMASATSSTISVRSLVLDIYDPTTKQLVWTGTATKTIEPSSNQEKKSEELG